MCHQRKPPDLLSSCPGPSSWVLGLTHGGFYWKTEWGLDQENKGGLTLPWPFLP